MLVKEILKCEEVLLRLMARIDNKEIKVPFNVLYLLNKELKEVGEITDLYFNEAKDDAKSEEILNSYVDYNTENYNKILSCKEIKDFYALN